MILSMTGYGKAVVAFNEKKINVEVKSLNSKSLDISTRIAPLYREKEMELRQKIQQVLIRGKVDFSLWIDRDASLDATPINADTVRFYYDQINRIAYEQEISLPMDWSTLLRLPDVMTKQDNEELSDEEWAVVCQVVDRALQELVEYRSQEGAALEKKFNEKVDNIETLLHAIDPYEKARVEKIRSRLTENLATIKDVDYDKNRLEQELIYYIEKFDISEEKQRLSHHLNYFRETMAEQEGGQGKKLGFIAQEMGREINTTGSKSNQAEMQNIVVQMKDELEQIKEQVLNVL
ncbi:MAG: YicC/YloC family endoribonuclease [Prevotella sp.]